MINKFKEGTDDDDDDDTILYARFRLHVEQTHLCSRHRDVDLLR